MFIPFGVADAREGRPLILYVRLGSYRILGPYFAKLLYIMYFHSNNHDRRIPYGIYGVYTEYAPPYCTRQADSAAEHKIFVA